MTRLLPVLLLLCSVTDAGRVAVCPGETRCGAVKKRLDRFVGVC